MDIDELRISRAAVVTVAQAASVFGVDVRTVSRAIENGELPSVRLGRGCVSGSGCRAATLTRDSYQRIAATGGPTLRQCRPLIRGVLSGAPGLSPSPRLCPGVNAARGPTRRRSGALT